MSVVPEFIAYKAKSIKEHDATNGWHSEFSLVQKVCPMNISR